jgi:hypothetical protein
MSQRCENCNEVAYKLRFMPTLKKSLGYGSGSCRCAEKHLFQTEAIPKSTKNPFDYTLNHVHDEFGKPLRVHSIKELSAAETRLGFQSVVLNSDAQNFDDPPQQRRVEMADVHRWRYSSPERYRENLRRR